MISISLTDFIDFISSSGTTKQNQIAAIKKREQYKYRVDYWRELRNCITGFHAEEGLDKGYFNSALQKNFIDTEKREKCRPLLENYKKYVGKKQIVSKPIVKCDWKYNSDLTVRVNPELYLTVNNKETLIKFYFKKEPLSKKKIDLAALLLKIATQEIISDVHYAIFDLPQNKIWPQENPKMNLLPLLKGEAESLITIYKNLP